MSAASSEPGLHPTKLSIKSSLLSFIELFDFYSLLVDSLLHPYSAVNRNFPHLNPFNMFGGKTFNPTTDIPNIGGKVILVTGGLPTLLEIYVYRALNKEQATLALERRPSIN